MALLRDVSIKVKFLVAVGVLFLVSIAFLVVVLLAMKDISTMESRVSLGAQLVDDMGNIEIRHLQWNRNMANLLLDPSDKEYKIEIDPTACALGSWKKSESYALALAFLPGIKGMVEAIDGPHIQMHASARDIIAFKKNGDMAQAYELFATSVQPSLQKLQAGLGTIREGIVKVQKTDEAQFAAAIQDITLRVWLFGGFITLMLLLLVYFLAKTILAPIAQISSYSEACLKGSCPELALAEANDELGIVARNIRALMNHLNRELAFSRGVLAGISVPFIIVSPDNIITEANQQMLDYIGFDGTRQNALGLTSGELVANKKDQETITLRALRERKAISSVIQYTNLKGKPFHTSVSSAPFFDDHGEMLGSLAIWTDMTEIVEKQKLAEEQQKRMQEVAYASRDIATEVTSATQEMSKQIEEASRGAEAQSDRVHETSTAMNEMNSTIQSVAQNAAEANSTTSQAKGKAVDGARAVEQVMKTVEEVTEDANVLKEGMAGLGKQTDGIGAIIGVINDIADQTNLLALNAAIEAARAGEAGRGFAVVADEVRKLAEKTMEATKEVGTVVSGIQHGTSSTIHQVDVTAKRIDEMAVLAQEASSSLAEIVALIEAAADQVHAIAIAAEQQSATGDEINRAIAEVNDISTQTSENMHHAEQAIVSLAKQTEALQRLIAQLG